MKLLKLFALFLMFGLNVNSYAYDISWYDDLSNDFYISTAGQLQGLAQLCNQGKTFENKTIHIIEDIDMSRYPWTVIDLFSGHLEGNGKSISNLSYSITTTHVGTYTGALICVLSEKGVVSDLKLIDESITVELEYGAAHVAGLIYENHGMVTNCKVQGTIQGLFKGSTSATFENYYVGGIVGYNIGKVYNSTFDGTVKSFPSHYSQYPQSYAGGIAGYNEGVILNCVNTGSISSRVGYDSTHWNGIPGVWPHAYSGGICGGNVSTIENVINYGNVTAISYRLGESEGSNAYSGAIVGQGSCRNSYYSSSSTITAPNIIPDGIMLSESQMTNNNFNFTSLLNQNVNNLNNPDVLYWANAPSVEKNHPFIINFFALNNQVTSVDEKSAILLSTPTDIVSDVIVSKGFEYKLKDAASFLRVIAKSSFQATLTGLNVSSVYTTKAFIQTNKGIVYSNITDFTTKDLSIETLPASDISATSATLRGKVATGLTTILSEGFIWKEENEVTYNVEYTTGDSFTKTISSLSPNTNYIYQSFITTSDGKSYYGNKVTFATIPVGLSFTLSQDKDPNHCLIKGDINIPIKTNVVVEFRTDFESNYIRKTIQSDENGYFNIEIDELLPDTKYIFRAYIYYDGIYVYSTNLEYITTKSLVYTYLPDNDKIIILKGTVSGVSPNCKVGFEYRQSLHPDIMPSVIKYAELSGNDFALQINDIENNVEYKCRAFYIDYRDIIYYGNWQLFIPTNIVPSGITNPNFRNKTRDVRYNMNGIQVDNSFKGVVINGGKKIIIR